MRYALLCLLACAPDEQPDFVIGNVEVFLGAHVYPDLPQYLDACASAVGPLDARLVFESNPQQVRYDCIARTEVAGCAWPGVAYVVDAPTIWQTAACHELLHATSGVMTHDHPAFPAADALEPE